MITWKENTKRVIEFYNSTYYTNLKKSNPKYIKPIITALMEDPDIVDSELYKEKVLQLNNMNITAEKTSVINGKTVLGIDCVIGWKTLYKIHNGNNTWIDDYAKIRSNLNAHVLWPRHNGGTINTVRAGVFNDKIDYTLYDIKCFYDGANISELMLATAYNNPITKEWLQSFSSFNNFVIKMKLNCFCNNDFEVIDLLDETIINRYKTNYKMINREYLSNLKKVINNSANKP